MNRLTYILWLALIGLTVAVPKRGNKLLIQYFSNQLIYFSIKDRNDYTKNAHRVVCYFNSWAQKRAVDPFDVDNVDTSLCTHLNWDFATLNEDTLEIEMADKEHLLEYQRFNGLRKKSPNLTTLVSLGGWKEGSQKFSDMAKTTKLRQDFVKSIVEFLKKYDFDGLDLDWEFPGVRQGNAKVDKQDLSLLLQELRTAFDPLGYVLTIAVSPAKHMIDSAYNVPDLNKYADWINLMTYDYHGGWDKQIGHNSPLYSRPDEVDEKYSQFNVNFSVNYIIEKGAQPKKIVMGMPFYGRGFTLANSTLNKLHDQANGYSPAGFISAEKGVYGYNEVINCLTPL